MKVALASAKIANKDILYNISQMNHYMQEAKKEGADLVCFGESFLQGFDALSWDFEEDKNMAVSVDSPEFLEICRKTREYEIDVLFGYIEREGDILYSSCVLISDGRIHHNYRRISRGWKEYWKTDDHYREGDAPSVFEYRGKRCVIALCGDLWDYPERFQLGADILFWPVYCDWTEEEWNGGEEESYAQHANLCCPNTLYINSVCDAEALGGAYWFADGVIKEYLAIGKEGILLVEI